jgi:hypothetical protein
MPGAASHIASANGHPRGKYMYKSTIEVRFPGSHGLNLAARLDLPEGQPAAPIDDLRKFRKFLPLLL